jgi:hypothetical protein
MTVRDEIHKQIVGALTGAKFPIKTPQKLLAAFPAGADTNVKQETLKSLQEKQVNYSQLRIFLSKMQNK